MALERDHGDQEDQAALTPRGHFHDIVDRATKIILTPTTEWDVAAGEDTGVSDVFYGYVLILAVIPPLATLIGYSLIFGQINFGFALIAAIFQYSLSLVAIFFVAMVTQWLAPKFGGLDDLTQAMKLVAYAHTATWLGGILFLVPGLSFISLAFAIYGIYLLYLGVTPVMAIPPERAITYTGAVVLTVFVTFFLLSMIMAIFFGLSAVGLMV